MSPIENKIKKHVSQTLKELFNQDFDTGQIPVSITKKDFEGDYTVVVFPFLKMSGLSPQHTAEKMGQHLLETFPEMYSYNVIQGFLNIVLKEDFWIKSYVTAIADEHFGKPNDYKVSKHIMVEYSSPNTNKPLHLGHIRNNLLGHSVSRILEKAGSKVVRTSVINDRGVHICKSMLAWKKWGNGETPETSGIKGDHLVGKYYVIFDKEHKAQVEELIYSGLDTEKAKKDAPLMKEIQEMLLAWENNDKDVRALWQKMNGWVYDGFAETYQKLGVTFDSLYYESETYLLGKQMVMEGIEKGVLFRKDDGSIWIDLTDEGLDEKLLLRADGTSVYMTQDLGTAQLRFSDFPLTENLIYVVGNEQDYHFKVLSLICKKLGKEWAGKLFHLSYAMVDLPSGKMKSREGTVVDADDLIKEIIENATQTTRELGKTGDLDEEEANILFNIIGMGALKYFILKVNPQKRMLFDPKESIDFNGNTGPFIQYAYARIMSLLRKAGGENLDGKVNHLEKREKDLIKQLLSFPQTVQESAEKYDPSVIAAFAYETAKLFNQFYHDHSVLQAESQELIEFRLGLSAFTGKVIHDSMHLLGIDVPKVM
jgi:arginyl-tRNA synthetase